MWANQRSPSYIGDIFYQAQRPPKKPPIAMQGVYRSPFRPKNKATAVPNPNPKMNLLPPARATKIEQQRRSREDKP